VREDGPPAARRDDASAVARASAPEPGPGSAPVGALAGVSAAVPAGDPPGDAAAWTSVVQMLAARRASLATTLNGSMVAGEDERMLRVAVPRLGSFQKGQLEKSANKQLIMELIREAFGRPLGIRFEPVPGEMIGAGAGPAGATGADPAPGSAAPANSASDAKGEAGASPQRGRASADTPSASPEGIRRIVDLFGGDVIGPA
jgi:hypothetical protein